MKNKALDIDSQETIEEEKAREKEEILEYYERNHWKIIFKKMLKDWRVYVMLIPLIFVFVCWRYLPMYGLVIGFKNYDATKGIMGSDFVGLAAFQRIFKDGLFWKAFRNTFMISFYGLCFGFPMPIILALLFSEIKNQTYRSILQIFTYLPKFVSLVVVTTLVKLLTDGASVTVDANGISTVHYAGGLLTQLLHNIGAVGDTAWKTGLLNNADYFRTIYQISGIWEAAGYGSIVYFAAILSISPTSYEAAKMDGANKWAQIRYVTFPGIASTLTIMLILEIGKLLTVGYEKIYLLRNDNNRETAQIVATYVMDYANMSGSNTTPGILNYAMSSAADLLNSLIAMLLVIGSNMISRRVSDTSLY